MGSRQFADRWSRGLEDVAGGVRNWRVSHLMGIGEIRRRYARSRLGQFWVTLSTFIMILTLGVVWSALWGQPVEKLMPYIGVSLITWTLISGILGEAPTTLVSHGGIYLNQGMSFSTAIFALVYKQLIIFAHNLPIILGVFLFFLQPLSWTALLAIPGLILVLITVSWMSYLLAITCLRYRDLTQVVASVLTVLFYVTPILWKSDQLPEAKSHFVDLNPFAAMLSVVRDPLLGHSPPESVWLMMMALAFGGSYLALAFIGTYRNRIVYWI